MEKTILIVDDFKNTRHITRTQRIREMPQYSYVPVLMVSTETAQDKKQKAADAGITTWIHKPFDFQKFLLIVSKALR